jgi:hypothetical protein
MTITYIGLFIFSLIIIIGCYLWSNRTSTSSVPVTAEEQKRIDAKKLIADGMPCNVDVNGKYTYQNKICIPTSCNTGYTKYNNKCYADKRYAEEQRRIDDADGMPCNVDVNGKYTYQNKICIPTSCNTGYTKYNNKCYADEWHPHSRINSANVVGNIKDIHIYRNMDSRFKCMENCHANSKCSVYSYDNNGSCYLYKATDPKLMEDPSTFMTDAGSWDASGGNTGFGFI